MKAIQLQPIGIVRSGRSRPEDDHWDRVPALVELARGESHQPTWMSDLMKEYWE